MEGVGKTRMGATTQKTHLHSIMMIWQFLDTLTHTQGWSLFHLTQSLLPGNSFFLREFVKNNQRQISEILNKKD